MRENEPNINPTNQNGKNRPKPRPRLIEPKEPPDTEAIREAAHHLIAANAIRIIKQIGTPALEGAVAPAKFLFELIGFDDLKDVARKYAAKRQGSLAAKLLAALDVDPPPDQAEETREKIAV